MAERFTINYTNSLTDKIGQLIYSMYAPAPHANYIVTYSKSFEVKRKYKNRTVKTIEFYWIQRTA